MKNQITCPNCKTKIDVEKVLAEQISMNFEQTYIDKQKTLEAEYQKKNRDLDAAKESIEEQVKKLVSQKELQLKMQIKKDMQAELEFELTELKKENQEKTEKVKTLVSEELKLRKEKRQLEEDKLAMELEVQRQLDAGRKEIEAKARKSEQESTQMAIKEKDMMLENMSRQLEDLKRKIEQGSVQSQGEVQEIELEKLLASSFPVDEICEVPKGVQGADCIQLVRNYLGKECGTIIYESKRTKSFGKDWIDKLKADMRAAKADVAILVTEVLPKDMQEFGNKDGVLVCSFNEVRALSAIVRDSLIKLSDTKLAQENRGEKMQVLYNYLTSNDFFQHFSAVVNSFTKMKGDIDSEKRAMKTIWNRREKELDVILESTVSMYGSIKAIAGSAIGDIKELELGEGEQLKL